MHAHAYTRFMFHQRWVCDGERTILELDKHTVKWQRMGDVLGERLSLKTQKVNFQLKRTSAVWQRLTWQLHKLCKQSCTSTDNPLDSIKTSALQRTLLWKKLPHRLTTVCVWFKLQHFWQCAFCKKINRKQRMFNKTKDKVWKPRQPQPFLCCFRLLMFWGQP